MTVATIVQARTGSRRLPGKVLLPIGEASVLERVLSRVRNATSAGEVVVATTELGQDDPIEELCRSLGVRCTRGAEQDVLSRLLDAARSVGARDIVRVTADSPLLAPELLDVVVRAHLERRADYVWIVGAAVGLTCETLSVSALERAAALASLPADREHVVTYVVDRPEEFEVVLLPAPPDVARPELRLTLDDGEDLRLIRSLYERSSERLFELSGAEVVAAVDRDAELARWATAPHE